MRIIRKYEAYGICCAYPRMMAHVFVYTIWTGLYNAYIDETKLWLNIIGLFFVDGEGPVLKQDLFGHNKTIFDYNHLADRYVELRRQGRTY